MVFKTFPSPPELTRSSNTGSSSQYSSSHTPRHLHAKWTQPIIPARCRKQHYTTLNLHWAAARSLPQTCVVFVWTSFPPSLCPRKCCQLEWSLLPLLHSSPFQVHSLVHRSYCAKVPEVHCGVWWSCLQCLSPFVSLGNGGRQKGERTYSSVEGKRVKLWIG